MDYPQFKHDCARCTFLGSFRAHDLYHCKQSALPTLIARYGNDGPDYFSGIVLADHNVILREAKVRAVERKLVCA